MTAKVSVATRRFAPAGDPLPELFSQLKTRGISRQAGPRDAIKEKSKMKRFVEISKGFYFHRI